MTKTDTPMKFARSADLVYTKALALRNLLADVEDDWDNGALIMDRWTYANFMRAARDVSVHEGYPTWAGLKIKVQEYQPPLSFRSFTDGIPTFTECCLDDDPFLLCIRFRKRENKRVVYIDDPDLHPYWR